MLQNIRDNFPIFFLHDRSQTFNLVAVAIAQDFISLLLYFSCLRHAVNFVIKKVINFLHFKTKHLLNKSIDLRFKKQSYKTTVSRFEPTFFLFEFLETFSSQNVNVYVGMKRARMVGMILHIGHRGI